MIRLYQGGSPVPEMYTKNLTTYTTSGVEGDWTDLDEPMRWTFENDGYLRVYDELGNLRGKSSIIIPDNKVLYLYLRTYNILVDEGHVDPNVYTFWTEKFNTPIVKSKYIVIGDISSFVFMIVGMITLAPI